MKQLSFIDQPEEKLVFVIHKHQATRLHYDLRLQVGMSMPSWAVPRGPSLEAGVKRLATQVNDHDLEYRKFEGVIPEGGVGAGPVMIWDEGTYWPEIELEKGKRELIEDVKEGNKIMREGLKKGELKFTLYGKKLKGSFALIKFKGFGSKPQWLLIKHKDEHCVEGYDAKDYDYSARTKRTLREIEEAG